MASAMMERKSPKQMANTARAEAIFKPVKAVPLSEQALEKKAFDENRERLKSERLVREEASKR